MTREFVLSACSANAGEYQLRIGGICYHVCKDYLTDACFKLELCKSRIDGGSGLWATPALHQLRSRTGDKSSSWLQLDQPFLRR